VKRDYDDKEVCDLWPKLKKNMPEFFADLEVKPSLLHGDLWSGNSGEADNCPGIISIFLLNGFQINFPTPDGSKCQFLNFPQHVVCNEPTQNTVVVRVGF
jgi:hypothetical protein